MAIENKIGGNRENMNLVGIAPVIGITIIVVVGVTEIVIGVGIAVIATILVVHILMIEKGDAEIETESIATDTLTKRGKEIEENGIVEAGAEAHRKKKKTADMNAMTEMTATTTKIAICEHTL